MKYKYKFKCACRYEYKHEHQHKYKLLVSKYFSNMYFKTIEIVRYTIIHFYWYFGGNFLVLEAMYRFFLIEKRIPFANRKFHIILMDIQTSSKGLYTTYQHITSLVTAQFLSISRNKRMKKQGIYNQFCFGSGCTIKENLHILVQSLKVFTVIFGQFSVNVVTWLLCHQMIHIIYYSRHFDFSFLYKIESGQKYIFFSQHP